MRRCIVLKYAVDETWGRTDRLLKPLPATMASHAESPSSSYWTKLCGKFGSVWKVRDTEFDRLVAVKIPRAGQLDGVEAEQFLREARAAAQVKPPNIVSVHEVGREDGTIYIVSDFIHGARYE